MTQLLEFLEQSSKLVKEGGIHSRKNKVEEFREKLSFVKKQKLIDNPLVIAQTEKMLLGISLSSKPIDIYNDTRITHECAQFFSASSKELMTFGVEIFDVKIYVTKSGQSEGLKRADLIASDITGQLKIKIWSDCYVNCESIVVPGNSVIISGKRGYCKYSDYFIAEQVWQP